VAKLNTDVRRRGRKGGATLPRVVLAGVLLLAGPATAETLEEAVRAMDAGRHAQAAEWLKPLANDGDAAAQFRLGSLYYHGQGVPEDEVMAVFWWKKSAAHGNPDAMFQLAGAYLFGTQAGKFVSDPDREAAIWYFQAASAGHAEAQYHLGLLFLAGKGVIENRREAARWFRKAAERDHLEAKKALASIEKPRR
jgi:uncharacterized protein